MAASPRAAARVAALLALVALPACGLEQEPPLPPLAPDQSGPSPDRYRSSWVDGWPRTSGWPEAGADGPADGAASDGQACPLPAGANCPSGCAPGDLCCDANGGSCAARLELVGAADGKAVLRVVALAYVRCWAQAPTDDLLCYAFDTCAMTGELTDSAVSDWVCNKAGVTDFPQSSDYDAARGLCQCDVWRGQLVYRPDWEVSSVLSGKRGVSCLSYDKRPWYELDRLVVNDCQAFPTP